MHTLVNHIGAHRWAGIKEDILMPNYYIDKGIIISIYIYYMELLKAVSFNTT